MNRMVKSFSELTPELYEHAGGKGAMLSCMTQEGYPVPPGMVVLTTAFDGDGKLKSEAWDSIRVQTNRMRKQDPGIQFAVRSSALSEDSEKASFAGEFETVLNVRSDEEIRNAIHTVAASAESERVKVYTRVQGISGGHRVAVVIQQMVHADISGVLFTVNPVTGNHKEMTGNYVHGPGEQLVSGEANAQEFCFSKPQGGYRGPEEFRKYARRLYRYAKRLETSLGSPQDIEWAVAGGKLYLLQARPITTLTPGNLDHYEINDSLAGDDLWVNTNVGEAVPDVVTPYTWSLIRYLDEMTTFARGYYIWSGNICGRIYSNFGRRVSAYVALGVKEETAIKTSGTFFGALPEGIRFSAYPYTKVDVLTQIVPNILRFFRHIRRAAKTAEADVQNNPQLFAALQQKIKQCTSTEELLRMWKEEIEPYTVRYWWLQGYGGSRSLAVLTVKNALAKYVGEEEANTLLSHLGGNDGLASMGPVVGIGKVLRGEMDREEYLQQFGHRSPHELELSMPDPAEEADWLAKQIESYRELNIDVRNLLEKQRQQYEAALERFKQQYPGKIRWLERQLVRASEGARWREAARSEFTRAFRVNRAFARRVSELTGIGDDVFFLYIHEVLDLLRGKRNALSFLPFRKENYEKYKTLPPFPSVIRGRFDPFTWSKLSNRRMDYYDASMPAEELDTDSEILKGFPGASGIVEGNVRVLHRPEDGEQLQHGEILVAASTNIGWTPLFPKASAIITDVGAPLSHAAIVARELGIPAVVGCGNATMRLKTGDRVLVNGGQGRIQILQGGM